MKEYTNLTREVLTFTLEGNEYIIAPGGVAALPENNDYIKSLVGQSILSAVEKPSKPSK